MKTMQFGIRRKKASFMGKLCFCLLSVYTLSAYALSKDHEAPLYVEANSANFDNKTGIGRYEGSIVVTQGTSKLTADHAMTYLGPDHELMRAVVEGVPAHYQTVTDPKKPPLHAYALTIQFYPKEHKILLIGNARVVQGTDSYSAPEIEYDTEKQHVISKASTQGRTVIIFHPNAQSKAGSEALFP